MRFPQSANRNGGAALANARITFNVASGGGLLASSRIGAGNGLTNFASTTDGNGLAQLFYRG